MTEPEVGVVAVSRAGHDKGRAFLIVGRADEAHVLLSDGNTRTLAHPKKKKLRHVHIEPQRAEALAGAITRGAATDADVRGALEAAGYITGSGR